MSEPSAARLSLALVLVAGIAGLSVVALDAIAVFIYLLASGFGHWSDDPTVSGGAATPAAAELVGLFVAAVLTCLIVPAFLHRPGCRDRTPLLVCALGLVGAIVAVGYLVIAVTGTVVGPGFLVLVVAEAAALGIWATAAWRWLDTLPVHAG